MDIERMIMQARYAMQLEAEASSVKGGEMSDMEREQYQKQQPKTRIFEKGRNTSYSWLTDMEFV